MAKRKSRHKKTYRDYEAVKGKNGLRWDDTEIPKDTHTKTWWICFKGHRRRMTYDHVVNQNNGCAQCYNDARRKSRKDYESVIGKNGLRWDDIEPPQNTGVKTWWICSKGHRRRMSYDVVVYQDQGCPVCNKKARKTQDDYKCIIGKDGLRWDDTNIPRNTRTKTWWICSKGHRRRMSYSDVVNSKRKGCAICQQSNGEYRIAQYLRKLKIPYVRQKKFANCVHKRPLPFDFHLVNTKILIEYDGEQHFKPINRTGKEKQAMAELKLTGLRDRIKDRFAMKLGYILIRIPYTIDDIENYLTQQLKPHLSKDVVEQPL